MSMPIKNSAYAKNELKRDHLLRLNHLKMHTLGYNMFSISSNHIVYIEPLYLYPKRYIPKPDILAIEQRKSKEYYHWIEVKGGFSKKMYNEALNNSEKILSVFEDIQEYIFSTYNLPLSQEPQSDYSLMVPAIDALNHKEYVKKLKDNGVSVISGDYDNGKVNIDIAKGSFWNRKFASEVKNQKGRFSEPIIFVPTYIYSILFGDVMIYFTSDYLKSSSVKEKIKNLRAKNGRDFANRILTEHLMLKYNYPFNLADIYAVAVINTLKKDGIFHTTKIKIKPSNHEKKKEYEMYILDRKLEDAFKEPHIDKENFLMDELSKRNITVSEVNHALKGSLGRYY